MKLHTVHTHLSPPNLLIQKTFISFHWGGVWRGGDIRPRSRKHRITQRVAGLWPRPRGMINRSEGRGQSAGKHRWSGTHVGKSGTVTSEVNTDYAGAELEAESDWRGRAPRVRECLGSVSTGGGASCNGNMLFSSFPPWVFRHGSPASGPMAITLNTHPDALDDLENSCEEKTGTAELTFTCLCCRTATASRGLWCLSRRSDTEWALRPLKHHKQTHLEHLFQPTVVVTRSASPAPKNSGQHAFVYRLPQTITFRGKLSCFPTSTWTNRSRPEVRGRLTWAAHDEDEERQQPWTHTFVLRQTPLQTRQQF